MAKTKTFFRSRAGKIVVTLAVVALAALNFLPILNVSATDGAEKQSIAEAWMQTAGAPIITAAAMIVGLMIIAGYIVVRYAKAHSEE